MNEYSKFLSKLSSLATSYEDDTIKCMGLVKHFNEYFGSISIYEQKYLIDCNSDKLKELLNEKRIVSIKLSNVEKEFNGDVYKIIKNNYPLFYEELEFGMTQYNIEKFNNILYLIIYIIEEHTDSYEQYKETGLLAIQLVTKLASEFLSTDSHSDMDEIETMMNDVSI